MSTYGNNTIKLTHELNLHKQLISQLFKALHSRDSEIALREMDEIGTLTTIIPELETGRDFIQPALHYYDVLNHNLCTVGAFDRLLKQNEKSWEQWKGSPFVFLALPVPSPRPRLTYTFRNHIYNSKP